MPKKSLHVFLAFAVLLSIAVAIDNARAAKPKVKVIYGQDDRLDYFQISDPREQKLSQSTVAVVRAQNLIEKENSYGLSTTPYGAANGLCLNEPFYHQETLAFCSGFLVAPDVIVTAGHCARTQESCNSTRFVFGFRLDSPDNLPKEVSKDQVYSCGQLIRSVVELSGEDFAVIKLDRPVTVASPLALRQGSVPSAGDGLTVIGHPAGLPLKVAGGANIRAVNEKFLVANLDTYGGNSGSAVFNTQSGDVEGILVRGELDYVSKDGCRVSNVCANDQCRGEDVTRIDRVLPYIP